MSEKDLITIECSRCGQTYSLSYQYVNFEEHGGCTALFVVCDHCHSKDVITLSKE